jgi:hypothetical protein
MAADHVAAMGMGRKGLRLGYLCFFFLGAAFLVNAVLRSFPSAGDALILTSTVMYAITGVVAVTGIVTSIAAWREGKLIALSCLTILSFLTRATGVEVLWLRLPLLIFQPLACLGLPLWWFLRSGHGQAAGRR